MSLDELRQYMAKASEGRTVGALEKVNSFFGFSPHLSAPLCC